VKKLCLIVPILLLGLARAGDTTLLTLTGFSANGAHVAFQQTATGDGSGFPYSTLSVIDVARNTMVYQKTTSLENPGATENQARAKVLLEAGAALKKYGIKPGDQGQFVLGNSTNGGGATLPKSQFEFNALGRAYSLEITTQDLPDIPECDATRQLLEIRLYSRNASRSLQRDTKLPESRRCAYGYELHSVFLKGSSLVVFIAVTGPGFEGPNLTWMAVTTTLKP
jgi:predicted secreted protein